MKRSTVVRHFEEIASEAGRSMSLPEDVLELPQIREVWVGGDLVDPGHDIDHVVAILMFDVPAGELPEIALHPLERAMAYPLRIGKRPMIWRSRPASRPAWSHLERRVVRTWSLTDGPDVANLEGLRTPLLSGVDVVEPSPAELRAWLAAELPRSEQHLREMLDTYWDGDWRREHTDRSDWIHRVGGAVDARRARRARVTALELLEAVEEPYRIVVSKLPKSRRPKPTRATRDAAAPALGPALGTQPEVSPSHV